ncbi:hypothetical protein QBC39DRAFT_432006 [Podospora conica]|nr:hypothetical protein QBC39DRAFT_432006 [Schizothecium conicum]
MATPRATRIAYQNQLIKSLMETMEGHIDTRRARLSWRYILLRDQFERHTDLAMDPYSEADGVRDYVATMLDHEQYWGESPAAKTGILNRIIFDMDENLGNARTTQALMAGKLDASVDHELRAWIYFHVRILAELRRHYAK